MKMLRFVVALCALLSLGAAQAQLAGGLMFPGPGGVAGAAPTYTGPGDVVSGAKAWYGLRAYSAAKRGSNVADICTTISTVDTCVTMVSDATTGALVLATIGGLTCNNSTQICNIKTLYDQSGALACGGAACDATNATVASRPVLVVSCLGSLPCASSLSIGKLFSATTMTTVSQPVTAVVVANRTTAAGTSDQVVFGNNSGANIGFGFIGGANKAGMGAPTNVSASATDNAWHALQYLANGASSAITVDGTTTGSLSPGTNAMTNGTIIGTDIFGQNTASEWVEMGFWSGSFSSPQITSTNSNPHTYWGF